MKDRYAINRVIFEHLKNSDKKTGAIADKAGIRRDLFSRIIHCRRPIYADELIPIITAAGISLEEVLDAIKDTA